MILKKKKVTDFEGINKRNEFFKSIWEEREHKSEVSGEKLYNPINIMYFHHILPKRNFKEAEFDQENIVLLTAKEHSSVEMNIYKYSKINEKRKELLKKFNLKTK